MMLRVVSVRRLTHRKKGEAGSQGGDVMGSVSQSVSLPNFMLLLALWTVACTAFLPLVDPGRGIELRCAVVLNR